MTTLRLRFDTGSTADYRRFLDVRRLPFYRFQGTDAIVPACYADRFGVAVARQSSDYDPSPFLFDYQRDIARLAIERRKFAVFADCGLGKTLILMEVAAHAIRRGHKTLIVCPLMVVEQTVAEAGRFYDRSPEIIPAGDLKAWLSDPSRTFGITNYEAIRGDLPATVGCLILDESSILKSHYGQYGQRLIGMGRHAEFKLCLTGTPAPNDRIEYANHAVFLDQHRTVNAFLARYFVNRGETANRWELLPHAVRPFYRDLSHWAVFLTDPGAMGWHDNTAPLPPIRVHVERVELTESQRRAATGESGQLFPTAGGGIVSRATLSQIAKGRYRGRAIHSLKPNHVRNLVMVNARKDPEERSIVWCRFNDEQDDIVRALGTFGNTASIDGQTSHDDRRRILAGLRDGSIRCLVTKPKILGYGMNLQCVTRQVFSSLDDSYEDYYQAVKRSNRTGSTHPLDVHIVLTEIEEPMVANVLRKAERVREDALVQQEMFRAHAL